MPATTAFVLIDAQVNMFDPGRLVASADALLEPADRDLVLDKTTCDAFESTPLGDELAARGVTEVVIAGLQTEWCIRETTLAALDRGFGVTLVSDGHSTYDGNNHTAAEISAGVNAEFAGRARLAGAKDVRFA